MVKHLKVGTEEYYEVYGKPKTKVPNKKYYDDTLEDKLNSIHGKKSNKSKNNKIYKDKDGNLVTE